MLTLSSALQNREPFTIHHFSGLRVYDHRRLQHHQRSL